MARNEEKQLGRLNRLQLKIIHDDEKLKNPTRPRLDTLTTADDISKWLPSIKKDMDFYLKQSQVPCYPEAKIDEFSEHITRLRKEYMAFVRKIRHLGREHTDIPWVERRYSKRHKTGYTEEASAITEHHNIDTTQDSENEITFTPLDLPVLVNDDDYKVLYGYATTSEPPRHETDSGDATSSTASLTLTDAPLQFTSIDTDNGSHNVQSGSHKPRTLDSCKTADEESEQSRDTHDASTSGVPPSSSNTGKDIAKIYPTSVSLVASDYGDYSSEDSL